MDTTQDWLKRGSSGWSSKGGSGGHGASNGPTVGLAQATCLWRSASPCEGPRLPRQPGPRRRIAGLTSWCLLSFTNHQMVPTALDVMTRSDGDVREETRPALAGGSMTCCGRFGKWGAGSVIHAASPKPRAEAMAATHSAHGSGSELGSAGRFSLCVSNAVHPVPRVGFSPSWICCLGHGSKRRGWSCRGFLATPLPPYGGLVRGGTSWLKLWPPKVHLSPMPQCR